MSQTTSTVREIVVAGNERVSREAIQAAMRTKPGTAFVQNTLDSDKQAIEEMGFFQAVDLRAVIAQPDGWKVLVDVKEFPVIKEIRIVGNRSVKPEPIIAALQLKVGEVYNLKKVKPSAEAVNAIYTKAGFFGRVDDLSMLKDSPGTLNVSVVELTVGDLKISGNTRTKDTVVKKLIKTKPGDVYNQDRWFNDLKRIYQTGWFEVPKSLEDDRREYGKVDLTVDLKEQRTGQFGVGVTVDPQSSIAGFLRYSESNFRGTGQTVGASIQQATTGGGISADVDYGNSFLDSRDTAFNVSLYSRVVYRFQGTAFGGASTPTDNNRYFERRTGTSFGFTRPVQQDVTAGIALRAEGIKTSNIGATATTGFIQQDGDIGLLTLSLNRNKRDTDIDPSRGNWSRLSLEPGYSRITKVSGDAAEQTLLGSNFFSKVNAEYRAYFSPGQKPRTVRDLDAPRRVIAFRAKVGSIQGKVPFFEQYFVGGSDTVRGYAEDRFWGKRTFISTLEYRLPVQKSFGIVTFADYGGAWGGYGTVNSYTQSYNAAFHLGYGAGISVRTPLGPIRLDFGFDNRGKARTHFLIGTSF